MHCCPLDRARGADPVRGRQRERQETARRGAHAAVEHGGLAGARAALRPRHPAAAHQCLAFPEEEEARWGRCIVVSIGNSNAVSGRWGHGPTALPASARSCPHLGRDAAGGLALGGNARTSGRGRRRGALRRRCRSRAKSGTWPTRDSASSSRRAPGWPRSWLRTSIHRSTRAIVIGWSSRGLLRGLSWVLARFSAARRDKRRRDLFAFHPRGDSGARRRLGSAGYSSSSRSPGTRDLAGALRGQRSPARHHH